MAFSSHQDFKLASGQGRRPRARAWATRLCWVGLGLASLACWRADAAMLGLTELRCEHQREPRGIEAPRPRLSWQLVSNERGQRQTACQILVASEPNLLSPGKADLWDSGKLDTDQSHLLRYAGAALASRQVCFWKVRVWDRNGRPSGWSPTASWEMGLLRPEDWGGARWICLTNDSRPPPHKARPVQTAAMPRPEPRESWPSPLFRREFEVRKGVARARAYVCGLGCFELYANGRRVGDAVLDPAQTTYDARAFYVIHDLAPLLKPGRNALGLWLGNGFFGQNIAFANPGLAWGPPAVIARIIVEYEDGATETLGTDRSWRTDASPIVFDNIYAGETYDAWQEQPDWSRAGFNDAKWRPAVEVPSPTARLVAQQLPPMRPVRTLRAQRVTDAGGGRWLLDFGQNLAGWVRLRVREAPATAVKLRLAETLTPDGKTLEPATTGVFATGVEQQQVYICRGGEWETWEPRFSYHGFRYAEVSGLSGRPDADQFEAVVVRTDLEPRGSFTSSDSILNRLYEASLRTIESNLHGTAEECPHREKTGALGGAHAVCEATLFNFDAVPFWTKFVDDIGTVLGRGRGTSWGGKPTPGIPCDVAVGRRLGQEAQPDWGAACVLIPWFLHLYCGDASAATRHYDTMVHWVDYVGALATNNLVHQGYGDWCPPGGNTNMQCPPALSSTAFHYATLRVMSEFALAFEKPADAARFAQEAEAVRAAFNREFRDFETGNYGSQTGNALALRFGLRPADGEAATVAALASEVRRRNHGHAVVGLLGGRSLFSVLNRFGHEDLAYDALTREPFPSFRYLLDRGLTTWPEHQRALDPQTVAPQQSLNHLMHAAFAAWFHESLAGLRPTAAAPGFKHFELRPHNFRSVRLVDAAHRSPYGLIRSRWESRDGRFDWLLTVPPNSTATIQVPAREGETISEGGWPTGRRPGIKSLGRDGDRAVFELASGEYRFTSRF